MRKKMTHVQDHHEKSWGITVAGALIAFVIVFFAALGILSLINKPAATPAPSSSQSSISKDMAALKAFERSHPPGKGHDVAQDMAALKAFESEHSPGEASQK